MSDLELRCEREIFRNAIDLYAVERGDREGIMRVGKPVVMEEVDLGYRTEPTLSLPFDAAQRLMDELWRIGLRPTDYRDTDGEVAAQKEHITDLRKVLDFHLGTID
mgnify:CR=1 FL=1